MRLMRVTKKPKKEKIQKLRQWQIGYSPRPPTTLNRDINFCVVGALLMLVLSFKFDKNQLGGYRDVRGQNLSSCITLVNSLHNHVLLHRRDCQSIS